MSWFESVYKNVFWVVSRFESKLWKAFWVVSWFESKLWKAFWVVSRFESELWKVIWVVSQFESNSRKLFLVVSWFKSIIESHCESRVDSESKLSETALSWIEKVVPMSAMITYIMFMLGVWRKATTNYKVFCVDVDARPFYLSLGLSIFGIMCFIALFGFIIVWLLQLLSQLSSNY